jgi:hypothetical protein
MRFIRKTVGCILTPILSCGLCAVGLSLPSSSLASQGVCSNEILRPTLGSTFLPDCRAYEAVTPTYKEGYPFFVGSYSRDGSKAILYSLANIADSPGDGESLLYGQLYLALRTASGWHLSSLNPSLAEFVGQIPEEFEANSGETLWMQHRPEQSELTRDLYIRSAVGDFSLIGPLSPPVGSQEEANNTIETEARTLDLPVAATHDYSHVIIFAENNTVYWKQLDDTEGDAGSLYEYTGTDNSTPTLVGVEGGKGSTQLIGRCGTQLGGGRGGSAYNALSSDGETIFFTVEPKESESCSAPTPAPASQELYARVHGSPSAAMAAETVHVSANKCTVACGAESGKNFEGASEDGKHLFFTSTQKLTNNAVDGTSGGNAAERRGCAAIHEGAGCDLYEYDFDGSENERLRFVADGVLGVAAIAEDGSRVYFVSHSQLVGTGPSEGQPNLYVYDAASERVAFIATLNSEEDAGDWRRKFERPVEVAGEGGRYLLFESVAHLTPDDTSSQRQLFEYDAVTGELVRVTKGEDSFNENGNGVTAGIEPIALEGFVEHLGNNFDFKSVTDRQNVSLDGRTVFFETAGELSPRALSAGVGCTSLYEFHSGGLLREGVVSLVSDGRDVQSNKGSTCGAQFQGVDESGGNVLFTSADSLVGPSGVDGVERDVFDARVGGGFAPAGESGLCGLGSCEGGVSGPPVFGAPASVGEVGEAPVAPVVSPSGNQKGASHKKAKKGKAKKKKKGKASGRRRGSGVGRGVVVARGARGGRVGRGV